MVVRVATLSALALDQVLADGEERELQTIGDTELAEDLGQVVLHRFLTERDALRDLAVAVAGGHRRHDLELPRREGRTSVRPG